jgi:sulfite reductase beta subunit-like hemoprotein
MGRFKQQYQLYYDQLRAGGGPYPRLPRSDRPVKTLPVNRKVPLVTSFSKPGTFENSRELNVLVPSGEIEASKLRLLADLTGLFGEGHLYFTREQNIRFKNLDKHDAADLKEALVEAGFKLEGAGRIDDSLACPGTAFCPVGATPSLDMAAELNQKLRDLIDSDELPVEARSLRIHISGCPNSCAQHQIADIGLSGTRVARRNPGFSGLGYQIFLGGSLARTGKLALLAHYGVPAELVFEVLQAALGRFFEEKEAGESFTDYVHRLEPETWEDFIEERLAQLAENWANEKPALKQAV